MGAKRLKELTTGGGIEGEIVKWPYERSTLSVGVKGGKGVFQAQARIRNGNQPFVVTPKATKTGRGAKTVSQRENMENSRRPGLRETGRGGGGHYASSK